MPTVPAVQQQQPQRIRDVAAPPRPEASAPALDVPPPSMPALLEGMPASERAAALLSMLAAPEAWLRRR